VGMAPPGGGPMGAAAPRGGGGGGGGGGWLHERWGMLPAVDIAVPRELRLLPVVFESHAIEAARARR
jgi:hypothetical protein